MIEEPMSIDRQEEYIYQADANIEDLIMKMKELLQDIPFEILSEEKLKNKLSEFGFDHYIDPAFPPTESSIWSSELDGEYPLREKPVWKRPKEFMKGTPKLFEDGIDPNDINQGSLGDWWFLASLASIAENPALVKRLFITQEYNEEGIYRVKVCKNGEWMTINIDDYIPCHLNGGPMFASNEGNELWTMLLEKAYAKVHGNYCQLRSGFLEHGMCDLTGCPTIEYKFPEGRHDYYQIEEFADDLWDKLTKADIKGYIMWGATPGVDKWTEGSGPNNDTGIVAGHAYSVISWKSYQGERLLKIRNPWGEFEWGGRWSDNSPEWTEEFIEVFAPKFDAHDGTFWMWYEDFFKYFWSITIWKVENWYELRLRGKFIKVWELEDPDEDWVLSKFYYTFHLDQKTKIEIGLHQEDERIIGADRRGYLDMQILILKRHGNGTLTLEHDSGSSSDRDLNTSLELQAGHYVVIPRTSGATLRAPSNPKNQIPLKINFRGKEQIHAFYKSTFDDIFNKLDLQLNSQLSAGELNQFGQLIDNDVFEDITEEDLVSEDFHNISWDENGLTRYGFHQILETFSDDRINDMLYKLGYDNSLYSLKSRMFTLTFHSSEPLRVRISDAIKTDLNERAWDLMMSSYNKLYGATGAIQDDRVIVFRKHHEKSHSLSYGAINKTDYAVEVIFKQENSRNMFFSPSKGSVRTLVPPKSLVFLASSIVDPAFNSYGYRYSFSSQYV
jgi:calpain-15